MGRGGGVKVERKWVQIQLRCIVYIYEISKEHVCEVVGGSGRWVWSCVLDLISSFSCCGIIRALCFQGIFKPMDLNRIIKVLEEEDKVSNL